MEYKERQYKVRAFIDYVDGDSFEMSSVEVRQELKASRCSFLVP